MKNSVVSLLGAFLIVGTVLLLPVGGLIKHLGNWDTLVHTAATFAVFWLLLWYMYRKKTFIKI